MHFVCLVAKTCVTPFVTPWTVAHQALCPWDVPGTDAGVSCHFLLQEIFLTQESNLHWQSPSLASEFFTTKPPGKPLCIFSACILFNIWILNICKGM